MIFSSELGSFACCNGDTWASELGTVLGSGDPFLITSRKRVPRGTNGGVSYIGLFIRLLLSMLLIAHWFDNWGVLYYSFFGGLAIGVTYYLTVIYTVDYHQLIVSPQQWPVILFGGIAGLIGSIIDSVIGATLQYSGRF